jgi:hypothetical protein
VGVGSRGRVLAFHTIGLPLLYPSQRGLGGRGRGLAFQTPQTPRVWRGLTKHAVITIYSNII